MSKNNWKMRPLRQIVKVSLAISNLYIHHTMDIHSLLHHIKGNIFKKSNICKLFILNETF